MYSNNILVQHLISLLKQFNINKIVVSPGSRHFSIVRSIENDTFFELFSVVDERSAAFFALGLIQKSNEPVAITCTSGTSVINYGSAVIEAFYQKLPLLLLTGDRLPELLGQMEDQMYKQDDTFHHFIKFHGQLKQIKNSFDEWYCNRIINEGLLALNYHGQGPVQLNIPIESHRGDTFDINPLPVVRKINRYFPDDEVQIWEQAAHRLKDKKVMVVWGQTHYISPELKTAFKVFAERYNCVVLTDNLSNYNEANTLDDTFILLRALKGNERSEFCPDVIISIFGNYVFNGEIKQFLYPMMEKYEHWLVSPDGSISDPFRKLTNVFEMKESFFFEQLLKFEIKSQSAYYEKWKEISSLLQEPRVEYSELYAIGEFIHALPPNVDLHIANSSPIRMASTFKIDPSVRVFCNRGVNGIDGCLSTAVGFSASSSDPTFIIIGDLTFFYDMNSLWIRHLSKSLRILLLNNEGGAVMHMPLPDSMANVLTRHISAGHVTSAKGWVESLGINYFAASNEEECKEGIRKLTDLSIEGPIVLEVFTKKGNDVKILRQYLASLDRETLMDKVRRKATSKVKGFLKRI